MDRLQLEIERLTRELGQRDLRIQQLLQQIEELKARKVVTT